MMKLARLVLMMFLVAGWTAAQSGAPASSADTGKKDSAAAAEHKGMSCGCCKNMAKQDAGHKDAAKSADKDAAESGDKDAAKSEAKSEGAKSEGMMAGGMGCCAGMGKDKAGAGMKCGGGSDSKSEALPDQKMK